MGVTDIGPIADHDAVNNVLLPSDNEFDSTVVHTVALNGALLNYTTNPNVTYYKRSTWPPTVNLFDPNTMSTVLVPINISGESNCYLYTPQFIDSTFMCNNEEECRESAAGDALNDTIQTLANADSLAAYYTMLRSFKALFNDSTLLVLGVASDTAYNNFYSNAIQSSMGKLRMFEKHLKQNDTLGARQFIENLTPQNLHEHIEKTVDELILKYLRFMAETISDSTSNAEDLGTLQLMQSKLSAAELSELYNIAYQNAESFGMAVYKARGLLELYVHTPVASSGYRTEGEQNIENNQISVYPNPSNGMITIEGISNGIITINDLSGRGIYETVCNEDGITQLYLQLIDGVYLLKINSSVDSLLTFKLVIIR